MQKKEKVEIAWNDLNVSTFYVSISLSLRDEVLVEINNKKTQITLKTKSNILLYIFPTSTNPYQSCNLTVRTMEMDESFSRILDENMALIETPLIAPSNSYYRQHYKTALYPYNISAHSTQSEVIATYDSSSNDNGNIGDVGGENSYEKQSRYHTHKWSVCQNVSVVWNLMSNCQWIEFSSLRCGFLQKIIFFIGCNV